MFHILALKGLRWQAFLSGSYLAPTNTYTFEAEKGNDFQYHIIRGERNDLYSNDDMSKILLHKGFFPTSNISGLLVNEVRSKELNES